jgi:hypothetical protein
MDVMESFNSIKQNPKALCEKNRCPSLLGRSKVSKQDEKPKTNFETHTFKI